MVKSAASLGLFDLIAIGVDFDHALLVQVKANRMPCNAEMYKLKTFQVPCFCRKEIWIFKDYAEEPTRIAF